MYRIGIDLGGTNIAVGVVDDGHAIVSRVSVPTMASRPAAEVVRDMGGAVEQVLARAGASVADCRSMGVGSPGTCNSADGVVERAYNLGWDHVPVCRMLEQRFGIPCRLSNDANCAALAETVAGAAVGRRDMILITLGTGVGGGVLRDVCCMERPYIFTKHIYALASLAGAAVCMLLWTSGQSIAMLTSCALTVVLRVCAAVFRWSLPKARP